MNLGLGLGITQGGARSLAAQVAALFGPSDTGWFYDNSDFNTMFQDSAGTIPVTAVGQPVGLQLDKSGNGNHRFQSVSLNRPTLAREPLGGRRNLLAYSEQFDNAAWAKGAVVVVPDYDRFSDLLYPASSGSLRSLYSATFPIVSGDQYQQYITIKSAGVQWVALLFTAGVASATTGAFFDVVNGIVGTTGAGLSPYIINEGDGWFKIGVGIGAVVSRRMVLVLCDADNNFNVTVSGTNGVLIRDAQLELGSTATAYQKVTTAYDVTEAGVPDLYYLSYDGVNDSLSTAAFNWGTDKATICAGVRKLSDAARGTIVERTASIASNNGAFHMTAPNAASDTFAFESKGTILTDAVSSGIAAPATRVLTGIGDIAGDSAIIRANGALNDTDAGDQGTGNYASAVTYFGARAGTSQFFNGREYSQFTINRLLTASELALVERYTNSRTGAY